MFVTTTVAPGTTAPEGSRTVPRIVPRVSWAKVLAALVKITTLRPSVISENRMTRALLSQVLCMTPPQKGRVGHGVYVRRGRKATEILRDFHRNEHRFLEVFM